MINKEVYLEEFEVWFRDMQGKPYDSMYYFARDAWLSACQLQEEKINSLEDLYEQVCIELAGDNY